MRLKTALKRAFSYRDMECQLAGGKEPELVREGERYRIGIVMFTFTHSLGSGTQHVQKGWTLDLSGSEWWWAGVGVLIAQQLSCHILNFTQCLQVGDRFLTVILANRSNSSAASQVFSGSLGEVPDGARTGDSVLLLMHIWVMAVRSGDL